MSRSACFPLYKWSAFLLGAPSVLAIAPHEHDTQTAALLSISAYVCSCVESVGPVSTLHFLEHLKHRARQPCVIKGTGPCIQRTTSVCVLGFGAASNRLLSHSRLFYYYLWECENYKLNSDWLVKIHSILVGFGRICLFFLQRLKDGSQTASL